MRASHRRRLLVALLSICALAVGLGAGGASATSSRLASGITVFAGSSMTQVLPQLDPGNSYSFGSSATLATQIGNGAPADVFMSANTGVPAQLYAQGVVEKPVNFIRNTLEVVVPKSNPAGIKSIYDLTKPGVTIDVAASTVPVGSYTNQVLERMALNSAIHANVVSEETSDANVVAKVALGQVDAGFVYLSDYVIDPKDLTLVKVPAWAQPKITYAMAIVAGSPNHAAAEAWMKKVLSPAGQAIFIKDGFLPVTAPVPAISKLRPAKARVGATVTMIGRNFTGTTSVTFQGVPAHFRVVSGSTLKVTVPRRAKTGRITVTNPAGTAFSKKITIA